MIAATIYEGFNPEKRLNKIAAQIEQAKKPRKHDIRKFNIKRLSLED